MPLEPPRRSARATEEIRQLENQQLDQKPVMRGRRILPAPIVQEKWLISAPLPPQALWQTLAILWQISAISVWRARRLPSRFRAKPPAAAGSHVIYDCDQEQTKYVWFMEIKFTHWVEADGF